MVKVIVNWSLCDGNGNCSREAPELFAMNDDDTMRVLQPTFGEDHRARAEAAVKACPKNALRLVQE